VLFVMAQTEDADTAPAERERVVIIGGGPAGLAAAAVLKGRRVDALVLEQADEVGASWQGRYDRLRLHTVRWLSSLPGLRLPRSEGRWVPRDGVVRYLKAYLRHHQLRVRLSTAASSVQRDERGWRVETSAASVRADAVIVATGYNRVPVMPEWDGMSDFTGELLHSSAYRTASVYAGDDVLVVGAGNSGAEIAVDLVEQGARSVSLSVRTAPHIVRRDVVGVPSQLLVVLLGRLPVRAVDSIASAVERLTVGDLSRYRMAPPDRGLYSRVLADERFPVLDVGLVGALKRGEVDVVPAVVAFDHADVVLAGGMRVRPRVVVAATGFTRGLDDLVGHLGVLDSRGNPPTPAGRTATQAPGLYFIGYSNPLSGHLRQFGIDARRVARNIGVNGHRHEPRDRRAVANSRR
jgi:putative flavoprotein involved in K+ transport